MNDAGVAKRYAQALFMLAEETDGPEKIGKELDFLTDTIYGNKDLETVYTGVQFANQSKKNVVIQLFKGQVSENVLNFALLLIEKSRPGYLADIRTCYHALLDEKNGIADATIYTAYPLNEETSQAIAEALGQATGKTIRLKTVEDKSLLAGVRLQYGDRIIDGSAKARLESMRKRLITQQTLGGESPQ